MIKFKLRKQLHAAQGLFDLDVTCTLEAGSLLALYGPSGAGKTSILRMLAGLMPPKDGHITVNDVVWFDSNKKINKAPQIRQVGFVFQDYALFPNMTVQDNIAFAQPKIGDPKEVSKLIDQFQLHDLRSRMPQTLSGGQKQRVALARTLAQEPQLLLLDEPLAALDHSLRTVLQDYILKVKQERQLTIILVSHDVAEIYKMADHVLVLEHGGISNYGPPDQVFSNRQISGKFQFTGKVISIVPSDVVFIITVLIGNNLVKVVADQSDANVLSLGDQVLVASKAFNPIIQKI